MPAEPCPLDRINKVLDDLNAFRDDAHIAAFKPYKMGVFHLIYELVGAGQADDTFTTQNDLISRLSRPKTLRFG